MNTILERFEQTVDAFPNDISVEDPNRRWTWKKLRDKARRAGSALAACKCQNKPVVLMIEKSCKALALLYGVLYSGGFYVFVDPEQPDQRLEKIFRKLEPGVIVAGNRERERLVASGYQGKILDEEKIFEEEADSEILNQIRQGQKLSDPLYAIFTSGSTGEPKGIIVSHEAAACFIDHFTEELAIRKSDILGNQAPFDFDVSVKDIFSSCFTGAKLVLIPRTYFAMPRQLLDYLCDKKVTTLIWAVSALCMISQFGGFEYRIPVSLKTVMFSGEVMPLTQLKIWQDTLPMTRFVNLYGPSEITCNCTYYDVPKYFRDIVLPIGKSFAGRKVFLMGPDQKEITEKNVSGEICVSGESLADGYYHDPEKTKIAFVTWEGQRTYKTGDIGYFGNDGELYFVGRKDFQIKHMGHRIELGEVESAMESIDGCERACCIFDKKSNRVYGFYQGEVTASDMRKNMKKRVPSYMIPNKLLNVQNFKLSAHGKIDRTALRLSANI